MVNTERIVEVMIIPSHGSEWEYSGVLMNENGVFSPIPLHTNPSEWGHHKLTPHNLFLVTSRYKMECGDWYIDDGGSIRQCVIDDEDYWSRRPNYKKIVASRKLLEKDGVTILRIDFDTLTHILSKVNKDGMTQFKVSTKEKGDVVTYNSEGRYIILNK